MAILKRGLAAGVALGALLALTAPASAAVVIDSGSLPMPPSPGVTTNFNLGSSLYSPTTDYYFAFQLAGTTDWQSQIAINYTLKGATKSKSAPLKYSLFEGTCTATTCTPSGPAIDVTVPPDQTLGDTLAAGSYYLQLLHTDVTVAPGPYKLGPSLVGSYTTAATGGIPEPAVWSMMILGMGGIGAAMRSRRKLAFAA
jgi:hypothetical protein